MKKTLLTLFAVVLTVLNSQAQTRLVLFEEFTGENCPPCASINPNIWSLFQSGTNPDHIFMIKYMVDIPSAGIFYNSNHTYADPRKGYYGCSFAPYSRMDGILKWVTQPYPGFPSYLVQGDIDSNAGVAPAFTIIAHRQYKGDSVIVKVDVSCLTAVSGTMKLHVAFVRSMDFTSAPGTNGEKVFENVVRNMYPNENGTTIASSWTVGQTASYTIRGARFKETLSGLTIPDSNVVVWIQDDNNKTVKQSAVAIPSTGILNTENTIRSMEIYPNPATTQATVAFNLTKASSVQLKVYNIMGQVVYTSQVQQLTSGEQKMVIPTTTLSAGIYSVSLASETATVTRNITIQK